MMMFSQALGLPVITAEEAEQLGRVESLTIDARNRPVACLRLSKAPKHATTIAWDAIEAVGRDAVIVRSRTGVDPGQNDVPAHHEALGRRVLTEHGTAHGTVKDVAFDNATGHILTLYTALGDIPADRLLGVGSYAVVVRVEPHGRPRARK
ncbi:PRC-barrel domain-containing protein [Streptomyces sp. NBC_00557]|uniref:PRC-barrel domain-containing protein n=1 Tax=Streptomyces sp. NBC_00557 TaxID=2975776 RepID=UPI002E812531|nr:PRC-barrel domain-containing protein [Streptomyces sp. NBC_00557]WUC32877.1 PRC-barrel domain-containing protein [Streptomyces sp. NBC_00557]